MLTVKTSNESWIFSRGGGGRGSRIFKKMPKWLFELSQSTMENFDQKLRCFGARSPVEISIFSA